MSFIVNLGKDLYSLDLDRGILLEITFDGMDIEEICFWGKSARPWFIGWLDYRTVLSYLLTHWF